jgi:carboxyl-terminal processing protease
MTSEELVQYENSSDNSFTGVGVSIELTDTGGVRVTYVYPGGGAEEAGLVSGDIITAVDGESVSGGDVDAVSRAIRREPGQTVVLSVLREDGSAEDITVPVRVIFSDPVSYELLYGGVGYIKLKNFEAGAAEGFGKALDTLAAEGASAFIYDVRNNGGGKVSELAAILDKLLPECEIFVSVDSGGTEKITRSDAAASAELPAVVLVNRNTFSAAEYFAAVLREYGRAELAGEHTTGKNRSQITLRIPFGGALHISSAQYLTPQRISLFDAGGIAPDAAVPVTEEEFAQLFYGKLARDDDPQLLAALELLGKK